MHELGVVGAGLMGPGRPAVLSGRSSNGKVGVDLTLQERIGRLHEYREVDEQRLQEKRYRQSGTRGGSG